MTGDRPDGLENCTPERVRELADSGHGRNQIVNILGVSRWSVDRAAREAGVTFDRSMTREATEAAMADAARERLDLGSQLREVARVLLADLLTGDHRDKPTHEIKDTVWAIGSAVASDARLGELALRERQYDREHEQDSGAAENFAELLHSIKGGFETLEEEDEVELQRRVDETDAMWMDHDDEG